MRRGLRPLLRGRTHKECVELRVSPYAGLAAPLDGTDWCGACQTLARKLLLADKCLEVLHELVLDLEVPGALSDVHDEEQL